MAPIMIDDDSDDDLPLAARPRPASAAKKPSRDSSSSEEPEWMKTFKSPVQKIVDDLSESDDDDAAFHAAMTGRSPGGKFEMGSTPAKVVKSPPAGDAKEEDDDDDGDVEIVEDDDALRGTEISDPEGPSEPSGTVAGPRFAKPSGPAPSAPAPKGPPPAGTSAPNRVGELPLLVPAALNRAKVFFECEGTGEAVDLEGDVGVVGRLLTESASVQMDLKGVVYDARILPTPTSIVILAVNATEAKVESVSNDYVQLRVDAGANNMGGATLDGYLGADSDDETERGVVGGAASAAVRAMGDVSDDEDGGKRKRGAVAVAAAAGRRASSPRTAGARPGGGARPSPRRNRRNDRRRSDDVSTVAKGVIGFVRSVGWRARERENAWSQKGNRVFPFRNGRVFELTERC